MLMYFGILCPSSPLYPPSLLSISTSHKFSYFLTQTGDVPLGIAAEEGYIEIVEILLNAKAKINLKNKVINT